MTEVKKLRIEIDEIKNNGIPCDNPVITWITTAGEIYPCIGEDYIEVEVTPDSQGFVEFYIQCEECDVCPPTYIKRGLCDGPGDCADCENCIDGWCVPLCADQLCVNDTCVECVDGDDCEGNKECRNGECVCPVDKPFVNAKGDCVACLQSENCGTCAECIGGGCVSKDCGDGVCDPETDGCVECMNSGDCTGVNECCVGKECKCCDGYTWDYELERCVKAPDCYLDADCKECEYCNDGWCVPVVCPAGYTCYEGDCVKICDCNNGDCPLNQTCVPYGDICICIACEGTCEDNGDCDEGCMCGGFKTCIPNPCSGSCEDGTDCGDGCGCDEDKNCVPCSDKSCIGDECSDIDGCKCSDNSKCIDSDSECSGTCDDFRDCPGVNCTCIRGECVSCDNFPCEDGNCDDIPGCECNINEECVGSDKGCEDEFTFEKDGCGAKIELTLKEKCACKSLILKSILKGVSPSPLPPPGEPVSIPVDASYKLQLRKSVTGNPLLSETTNENISYNDLPLTGIVEFRVKYELEDHGSRLLTESVEESPVRFELAGKSEVSYDFILWDIGSTYNGGDDVSSSTITVTVVEDIKLQNGCVYEKGQVLVSSTCSDFGCPIKDGVTTLVSNESKTFVDPLWKVFRTKDDTFQTPYRKLYKTPVSTGKYLDKLYGSDDFILGSQILVPDEGLLFGNQSYMAHNDCGCTKYASLGKIINCEPATLSYNLSDCNSTIALDEFTPQCSTNKDLSHYGASSADIAFSQAFWKLFINGEVVATFKHVGTPDTGAVRNILDNQTLAGWSYTTNDNMPIETIGFKMYYGEVEVCDNIKEVIDSNIPIPNNSIGCPNIVSPVYYNTIDKGGISGLTVLSVSAKDEDGDSVYVEDIGGEFKVHAPFGKTTTVRITYDTGCIKEYDIIESCCGSFSVVAEAVLAGVGCGGDLQLNAIVTGGAKGVDYTWITPDKIELTGQNQTLTEYVNGTYLLEAIDSNDCTAVSSVDVNVLDIEFEAPSEAIVCNGGDVDLSLTGTNGAVVEYKIGTGVAQTATLPATLTLSNVLVSTVVTYTEVSYGGCTETLNSTTMVTAVTNATANIGAATGTQQCVGDSPYAVVEGTPNSIVDYKINNAIGQALLNSSGEVDIDLPNAAGSYVLLLTKVTLGDCSNTLTEQETILVQDSPVINIVPNSYECSSAGGGNFQYSVQFEVENSTGLPSVSLGTRTLLSGNLYEITGIPSGQATVISAVNGTCTTSQSSQTYNCDCNAIEVPMPTPEQSIYTFCTGTTPVPTMEVTLDAACVNCRADWYDEEGGGTPVEGNSLTFTPPAPGAGTIKVYYVEAFDLDSGCVSNGAEVIIEESALPNSDFDENGANNYCDNGNSVSFSIPYETQVTYLWEVVNGVIQGSNSGTAVSIIASGIGQLDVTLTATNADGCQTQTVKNYSIVDLDFTIDAYDCTGNEAVLNLGGNVTHTYKAVFTNTLSSGTQTFTGLAGGSSHNLEVLSNGIYNISIEDENGVGCSATETDYEVLCVCKIGEQMTGGVSGLDRTFSGVAQGTNVNWEFGAAEVPDRFVIKIGGVIVLDTTPVTRYAECGCYNSNTTCLVDNGDKGVKLGDLVTIGGGTVTGSVDFSTKTNLDNSSGVGSGSYSLESDGNACSSGDAKRAIPTTGTSDYELSGTITVSAAQEDADIQVIVYPQVCGGAGTGWKYKIECS